METLKDISVPLIVAIITALCTAIVTINIKYAKSEAEALKGLGTIVFNGFLILLVIIAVISLCFEIVSDKELTRMSVASMVLNSTTIMLIIIMFVILKMLSFIQRSFEIHSQHLSLILP